MFKLNIPGDGKKDKNLTTNHGKNKLGNYRLR
jgi:hypothetical protein